MPHETIAIILRENLKKSSVSRCKKFSIFPPRVNIKIHSASHLKYVYLRTSSTKKTRREEEGSRNKD